MTAEFSISSSSINLLFVLFSLFFWTTKFKSHVFIHRVRTTWDREGEKKDNIFQHLWRCGRARSSDISDTQESLTESRKTVVAGEILTKIIPTHVQTPNRVAYIFRQFIPSTLWGTKVKNVSIFLLCPASFFLSVGHAALGSLTIPGESCLPAALYTIKCHRYYYTHL